MNDSTIQVYDHQFMDIDIEDITIRGESIEEMTTDQKQELVRCCVNLILQDEWKTNWITGEAWFPLGSDNPVLHRELYKIEVSLGLRQRVWLKNNILSEVMVLERLQDPNFSPGAYITSEKKNEPYYRQWQMYNRWIHDIQTKILSKKSK